MPEKPAQDRAKRRSPATRSARAPRAAGLARASHPEGAAV